MKILIIEDDAEIVEFISLAFEVGWPGTELISTHQGETGIELVETKSPDIIILDLGLPDIIVFEVLKRIRLFSTTPVIIVTVRESEADIVKGLEWGADEYVIKPFGQLELLARVRAVIRSRQYSTRSDSPLICGPLQFDPSSGQLTCASNNIHLTRTEALMLYLLMKNAGRVVTYTELAEMVWGDVYPQSAETLRVYIRRLRIKLATDPQHTVHIHSRSGEGYLLEIPA
jgi:two-component system response regulator VicR